MRPLIAIALIAIAGCSDPGAEASAPTQQRIGNLGGATVRLPQEFAKSLEYDSDPGLGERRPNTTPRRTYASKIRSFGFDVYYPDMSSAHGVEPAGAASSTTRSDASRLFVGLHSGEDYHGAGGIHRMASPATERPEPVTGAKYKRAEKDFCGLEAYVLEGVDPRTGSAFREHSSAQDLFVHRDSVGRVVTYIRCSNRQIASAPCKHLFDLEPVLQADVYVQYRRSLLCEWKQIEHSTKTLVLGFRVDSSKS